MSEVSFIRAIKQIANFQSYLTFKFSNWVGETYLYIQIFSFRYVLTNRSTLKQKRKFYYLHVILTDVEVSNFLSFH